MKHSGKARLLSFLLSLTIFVMNSSLALALQMKLPSALTVIEEQAFFGDTSITELVLPEGTKRIESQAFKACAALTYAVLPESIEYIADDAFDETGSPIMEVKTGSCAWRWAEDHGFTTYDPTSPAVDFVHYVDRLILDERVDHMDVASAIVDYAVPAGEAITWEVSRVENDGDAIFDVTVEPVSPDGSCAIVYVSNVQTAGEAVWRITAATPGDTRWSTVFRTVIMEKPDDFPTELILTDDEVTLKKGESYVLNVADELLNGAIPEELEIDWRFDSSACLDCEMTETGAVYTLIDDSVESGVVTVSARVGGVIFTDEVTINVAPSAQGQLYLANGLMVIHNGEWSNWVGDVMMHHCDLAEGEEIVWTVEPADEASAGYAELFFDPVLDAGCLAGLRANNFSGAEGTATYVVKADTPDGYHFEQEFQVTYVDLGDAMPAGISGPEAIRTFSVGGTMLISNTDVDAIGAIPEGLHTHREFGTGDLENIAVLEGGGSDVRVTFTQPGIAHYHYTMYIGGVQYEKSMMVCVDASPVEYELVFDNLLVNRNDDDRSFIGVFEVHPETYMPEAGESISWTVATLDGDQPNVARFGFEDTSDNGTRMELCAYDFTGETGTVQLRATATFPGGAEFAVDFAVTVRDVAEEDLPVPTVPASLVCLNVGDAHTISVDDFGVDGEIPEGMDYLMEIWIDVPEDRGIIEWNEDYTACTVTFTKPGVYHYAAGMTLGGMCLAADVTVLVETSPLDHGLAHPVLIVNRFDGSRSFVGDFWLNYDVYPMPEGETISWSLAPADESQPVLANFYLDDFAENGDRANLFADGFTGETGSIDLRVTATFSDGTSFDIDFTVEVIDVPAEDLPYVEVPARMVMLSVGDEYTVNLSDFGVVGEIPEGVDWTLEIWEHDLNGAGHIEWSEERDSCTVTFEREGVYRYFAGLRVGGVDLPTDVTVFVDVTPIRHNVTSEKIIMNRNEGQRSFVAHLWLDHEMFGLYEGESISWSLAPVDENQPELANFYLGDLTDNGDCANLYADGFTGETGPVALCATATFPGGVTVDTIIEVDVIDVPAEDLPYVEVPARIVMLSVGDEYTVNLSDFDVVGEIPEGVDWTLEIWEHDLNGAGHIEWSEERDSCTVTFEREGVYTYFAGLRVGGVDLPTDVSVFVDVTPIRHNVTSEKIIVNRNEGQRSRVAELWLDHEIIGLYEDESISWSLAPVDENQPELANFYLGDLTDNGDRANLFADGFTGETGPVALCATATFPGGVTVDTIIEVDVIDVPAEDLPYVEVPARMVMLSVGDEYTVNLSDFGVVGEIPEGVDWTLEIWEHDLNDAGSIEWSEESDSCTVTFEHEGVYRYFAGLRVGGIDLPTDVTVLVDVTPIRHNVTSEKIIMNRNEGQRSFVAHLWLDYEMFGLYEGESISWSLAPVDENQPELANFYLGDLTDNGDRANLFADGFTGEIGPVALCATATFPGGATVDTIIEVEVIDVPAEDLPYVEVPARMVMLSVGDEYTVNLSDFGVVGEIPEGVDWTLEIWEHDLNDAGSIEWSEESDSCTVTFEHKGVYAYFAGLRVGGIDLPTEILVFAGVNPVEYDLVFETQLVNRNEDNRNFVGVFEVPRHALGEGERIEWTVAPIDDQQPNVARFGFEDNSGNGTRVELCAYDFTGVADTVWLCATATLPDGSTIAIGFEVVVIDVPAEELPAATVPSRKVFLNVGEEHVIRVSDFGIEGEIPQGANSVMEIWADHLQDVGSVTWNEDRSVCTIVIDQPGVYGYAAGLTVAGLCLPTDVTLYVEQYELSVNVTPIVMVNNRPDGMNVLGRIDLVNYAVDEGETVDWSLDGGEAFADFYMEDVPDDAPAVDLYAKNFTGATGDATLNLTVHPSGGFAYTTEIPLKVVECIDLPGINVPDDVTAYYLQPGDEFSFSANDCSFDGEIPEELYAEMGVWEHDLPGAGDFAWQEEGKSFTVTLRERGIFRFYVGAHIGGMQHSREIVLYVGTGVTENTYITPWIVNNALLISDSDVASWIGDAHLQEYNPTEGEEVYWNLYTRAPGATEYANVYIDPVFEGSTGVGIRANNFTGEEGSTVYVLEMSTSTGYICDFEFELSFAGAPQNLPTDITVPEERVVLEVGETYTANVSDIGFGEGEIPENIGVYTEFWCDEPGETGTLERYEGGFSLTFNQPCSYSYYAAAYIGGIEYVKPVAVTVLPRSTIGGSCDFINQCLITDGNPDAMAQIAEFFLDHQLQEGETVTWSVEIIDSSDPVQAENLYFETDGGINAKLFAAAYTGETGDMVVKVTAETTTGEVWAKQLVVTFIPVPENFPTRLTLPDDEVILAFNVGDTLTVSTDDIVANGSIPEGLHVHKEFYVDELKEIAEWETLDDGSIRFTFTEAGTAAYGYAMFAGGVEFSCNVAVCVESTLIVYELKNPTVMVNWDGPSFVGDFGVDLDHYALPEGESVQWEIAPINEEQAYLGEFYLEDQTEDQNGVWLKLYADGFMDVREVIPLRVTATFPGNVVFQTDFEVEVYCVEGPWAVPMPDVEQRIYNWEKNVPFTASLSDIGVLGAEYIPEGMTYEFELLPRELEYLDSFRWSEDGRSFTFTPEEEGAYFFDVALNVGGMRGSTQITVCVEEVPLIFYPLYPTLVVNRDQADNSHVCNFVLDVYYYGLIDQEVLEWTIAPVDEQQPVLANIWPDTSRYLDGSTVNVMANGFTGETGTMDLRATAHFPGGATFDYDFSITVIDVPEEEMPKIGVPADVVYMNVGDTYRMHASQFYVDGTVPEGVEVELSLDPYRVEHLPEYNYDASDGCFQDMVLTIDEPGVYSYDAVMIFGGIQTVRPITLFVGEIVLAPQSIDPLVASTEEGACALVGNYGVNLENYQPEDGETIVWTVAPIDENQPQLADFYFVDQTDNGTWVQLWANNFTGETGTVQLRATATFPTGAPYNIDFTAEVVSEVAE